MAIAALLLSAGCLPKGASGGDVHSGSLWITSDPAGASIYLDGTYRGKTPLRLDPVSASLHHLRAVHSYFKPQIVSISVASDTETRLHVDGFTTDDYLPLDEADTWTFTGRIRYQRYTAPDVMTLGVVKNDPCFGHDVYSVTWRADKAEIAQTVRYTRQEETYRELYSPALDAPACSDQQFFSIPMDGPDSGLEVTREEVSVPAGDFEAYKYTRGNIEYWFVPYIGWVKLSVTSAEFQAVYELKEYSVR